MITYGFSIQGKSHIEKGVVCQDSSIVEKLKCGAYLGVVADGVGSAAHSDIGSKMAVEALYEYCNNNIDKGQSAATIEEMLQAGYEYAYERIVDYVNDIGGRIEDYDTTLSAVIYDGQTVVYGHAGDGGIIVRYKDGSIVPITERQKGADGSSVRPLRAGNGSWDFGTAKKDVASVLLLTDGMLDGVFQPVLVNLPSDRMALAKGDFKKDNVYVSVAEFFMNPYAIYNNKNVKKPDEFMKHILQGDLTGEDQETFLKCLYNGYIKLHGKDIASELCERIKKYYYAVWAIKNVSDDKSVVCLMNETVRITPQNIAFYQEPNWKWRQDCYNALLYGQPIPPVPEDDPQYFVNKQDSFTNKTEQEQPTLDKGEYNKSKGKQKSMPSQSRTDGDGTNSAFHRFKNMMPKKMGILIGILGLTIGIGLGMIVMGMFTLNKDKKEVAPKTTRKTNSTASPIPKNSWNNASDTDSIDSETEKEKASKSVTGTAIFEGDTENNKNELID